MGKDLTFPSKFTLFQEKPRHHREVLPGLSGCTRRTFERAQLRRVSARGGTRRCSLTIWRQRPGGQGHILDREPCAAVFSENGSLHQNASMTGGPEGRSLRGVGEPAAEQPQSSQRRRGWGRHTRCTRLRVRKTAGAACGRAANPGAAPAQSREQLQTRPLLRNGWIRRALPPDGFWGLKPWPWTRDCL